MKKLKAKQRGPYCQYCPPKTVRADYRSDYGFNHFACNEHKDKLPVITVVDDKDHYMNSTYYI